MSEFMHDPESLAEALDALFAGAEVPRDEVLLQTAGRVMNAPPPQAMSPEVNARIEAQVLAAFKKMPVAPRIGRLPLTIIIVALIIVVVGLFTASRLSTVTIPIEPTSTPSASATFTETVTPTPTETATFIPTRSASVTPTLPLSALPMSTDVNLIIEGAIEAINGSVIVIYGIEIHINPDDPLLTVIQVGDTVRIEGSAGEDSTGLSIDAVQVTVTSTEVEVNENGEAWRDNGNCNNPPPPWAPAHGWHRRCDPQPNADDGSDGMGRGGS